MKTSAAPCAPAPASAPLPTLVTVAQLAAIEPALTVGGIRFDLFNRSRNGLEASGAVIHRGRRILLDRAKYLGWLAAGTGSSAA